MGIMTCLTQHPTSLDNHTQQDAARPIRASGVYTLEIHHARWRFTIQMVRPVLVSVCAYGCMNRAHGGLNRQRRLNCQQKLGSVIRRHRAFISKPALGSERHTLLLALSSGLHVLEYSDNHYNMILHLSPLQRLERGIE
jgi:hypothetical protein